MTAAKPLAPYRVLEIGTGAAAHCGRLLADLGAEVVKVEPPSGDPMRSQHPLVRGVGVSFLWYNVNKDGVTLDLEDPAAQAQVRDALASFDVLIDGNAPGWLADHGLDPHVLRARYPHLVITSVSHFGQWGPYRDWQGSTGVHWALAGSLIRCGLPTGAPLTAPYQLPYALTGITAASTTVLALLDRGHDGRGDWLDCSVLEAVQAQADWSVPIYSQTGMTAKRSGAGANYPLFRCSDGWVRVVNLSARQWINYRNWLGNPPEISGPEWDNPLYRGANRKVVDAFCAAKCEGHSKVDIANDGQAHGVGVVPIYTPLEVMEDGHFAERGTFVSFPLPDGSAARAPGAFARMDAARPEPPRPAPALGGGPAALQGRRADLRPRGSKGAPFAGYRVVEVGSGAVAPEITRILGEWGAEVIKIESRAQIDFMRLQGGGSLEGSVGWSSSNRSKKSVVIDLKDPEGGRIGRALAERADIIVENNTGGVMKRLGLGYEELSASNPRLVYISSPAFGASGPWNGYGGFGPTNQAVSGVSYLWNSPDAEIPEGVQVIFPDHILGRVGALAVTAAVDEMERSGKGQFIDMGQAELAMACIGEAFIESDANGEDVLPRGNTNAIGAPWGVFPSVGDDTWIAITIETDEQWKALKKAVNIPEFEDPSLDTVEGRLEQRDLVEAQLAAYTALLPNIALMRNLQAAGVPAGAAYTTSQVLADVHLSERDWPVTITHPVLNTLRMEGVPFKAQNIEQVPSQRAPLWGEHTKEVLASWLGMSETEIAKAEEAGALK